MEAVQPAGRAPGDQTPHDRTAGQAPAEVRTGEPVPAGGRPGEAAPPEGRTGEPVPAAPNRRPRDMAISLLVLLLPIALLLGLYRVVFDGDQPVKVDPAPAIEQARHAGAFPVGEPVGLAPGWRTLSAVFRRADGGATLRIGYLSPNGDGVQLVESDIPPEKLLPAELNTARGADGTAELAGRGWQRYTARSGERALVLMEPGRTVIVVGSAGEQELSGLAGALR